MGFMGILLSGFNASMVAGDRAPREAPSEPAGELLGNLLDLAVPVAASEIPRSDFESFGVHGFNPL